MKYAAYIGMMGYLALTWVLGRSLPESANSTEFWILPWVAVGLFVLMPVLIYFIRKYPSKTINFNGKDRQRFKALDREGQLAVAVHVESLLWFTNVHMALLFGLIQWFTWATVVGQGADWHIVPILLGAMLPTPFILIVYLPRTMNELKRQEARMRAQA